jgi:hypothetical protein
MVASPVPVEQFAESLLKADIAGGATLTRSSGGPSRLTIDVLTTMPHPPGDA